MHQPLKHALPILALSPSLAFGEMINFDEFDATNGGGNGLSTEYQTMGVTFASPFSHIYDGVIDGDPGSFGLNGTDGPQFLGITSPLGDTDMRFEAAIFDVEFRVAAGGFAGPFDELTVVGWLENSVVDIVSIPGLQVIEWSTINLNGFYDRITMAASGTAANKFGLDEMSWQVVPAPSSIGLLTLAGLSASRRNRN